MAVISDEGGFFDLLASRYSNGVPNFDIYLKAHSISPYGVDRKDKTKPPLILNRPLLVAVFCPQPDVIAKLSDKPGFRRRGLLARILYVLPESRLGQRKLESRRIPAGIKQRYRDAFCRLLSLSPARSVYLHFTPEAYAVWKEFQRARQRGLPIAGFCVGSASAFVPPHRLEDVLSFRSYTDPRIGSERGSEIRSLDVQRYDSTAR